MSTMSMNKQKIPNQLVQVKQLGLLNENIDVIIESYLPSPRIDENDTKNSVAKITAENQAISNELIANFKPSISDQVKVGFYSTDRFTQTDETEIISLKAATETLEYLCNELTSVKYDLKFAKDSSKHQFELELHNKSLEIYGKMNEKLKELNIQQNETLNRIRQAYRSQLANALKRVGQFAQEQNTFAKMKEKMKDDSRKGEFVNKIKEMQKTIFDLEAKIDDLNMQLQVAKEDAKADRDSLNNQMKDEKERAVEEIMMLSKKIGRLEEGISIKEEETEKLLAEVATIQLELEKEKMLTDQLNREMNEMRMKNDNEKQKIKKEFEKQKIQMESKLHDKLKESRVQLLNAAKQELTQQEQEAQRKRMEFEEQEKALKEKLALAEIMQKEKEKEVENIAKLSKKDDLDMIARFKKNEAYFKADIQRLKREVIRTNETWEKKFDILKKSLHAIKDEMYLRQNLQKQSVHLAYASVAYTMDEAPADQFAMNEMSVNMNINRNNSQKKPLPSISNNFNNNQKGGLERQLSFTISVPSRLSGHLDLEETQIIDDDEMNRIKDDYLKDFEFIKPPRYAEAEMD